MDNRLTNKTVALPLWERIRRPNERSEFLAEVGEG